MEDLFILHILTNLVNTMIVWLMSVTVSLLMGFIHMFQLYSILI